MTTPYDVVVERLAQFEERPYAMRIGRRDWADLRRDPRTRGQLGQLPGDPLTFMGVAVRIEKGRLNGIPQSFSIEVYETPEQLHEAIYG